MTRNWRLLIGTMLAVGVTLVATPAPGSVHALALTSPAPPSGALLYHASGGNSLQVTPNTIQVAVSSVLPAPVANDPGRLLGSSVATTQPVRTLASSLHRAGGELVVGTSTHTNSLVIPRPLGNTPTVWDGYNLYASLMATVGTKIAEFSNASAQKWILLAAATCSFISQALFLYCGLGGAGC